MEDAELLVLSQLFDSIGIIEKGIERIYHYLLKNKRIDNLGEVCDQFNLSQKRGYKICSVLSDLGLVQIYDRPMKIHLANPTMTLWQNLINKRIEELQNQFQEKKDKIEISFGEFIGNYKLEEEQVVQEPVEFINYSIKNFDETYHSFLAKSNCKIAIGIRYDNPLVSMIQEDKLNIIPEETREQMTAGMNRIKDNLKNIDVQVIFNSEVIKDLLVSKEFKLLTQHIDPFQIEFQKIEIHVTDEDFSNFSLTLGGPQSEIIQPSFDPTNILIGIYVSSNPSIFQIFNDKFDEIFKNGISIEEFLANDKKIDIDSLSESESFALCVM